MHAVFTRLKRQLPLVFPLLLSVVFWLPILFLFAGSFTHARELGAMLGPALSGSEGYARWEFIIRFPTLQQYIELLLDRPQFFVMFWNSILMTGGSLLGQLLVSVPAAWWFSQSKSRLGRGLFTLYIVLMLMPFQVTMVSSYLVLDFTNLLDTVWAVILPAAFSTFPVFIMYRFFKVIPPSLLEAAQIDGANGLQVFTRVAVPIGSAGVASIMVLGFMENWNLIEQPMTFLKDKTLWPLSLYLPNVSLDMAGVAMAASVITLLPSLLVFLYGQSYLEQGILSTGMKE